MRELKPLNLPKMVAARNAGSRSTEDLTVKTTICMHASNGSFSSSTSDVSGPPTPTFSVRGHSRFPSGSSSLTSNAASPVCEHSEVLASTNKLPMPKLPEEPFESEEDFIPQDENFDDPFDAYEFDEDRATVLLHGSSNFDAYALDEYVTPGPSRSLRRQRSMDMTLNSLSMRLNSFASRFGGRKNASVPAGLGIETTNLPSRPASSRSSSFTSPYFPGFDQNDMMPPTPAMSVICSSHPVSPTDEAHPLSVGEPYDRHALSSTPLLPPMMNAPAEEAVGPVQSPLQSPTIADPNKTFSMVSSIADPARSAELPSPPLSMKPSIASFHHGRTSTLASVADTPPLHLEVQTDEWSAKLGHENFFIEPAPYLPEPCDADSCTQFINDWDEARQKYFIRRARIAEHYGVGSKTYKLTEEKWRSIDARWKEFSNAVSHHCGQDISRSEPAPLTAMPTLSDPRCDGKFPDLGDKDIVGAMKVAPPLPQTTPPSPSGRIQAFFQSMFGRSRSATR